MGEKRGHAGRGKKEGNKTHRKMVVPKSKKAPRLPGTPS